MRQAAKTSLLTSSRGEQRVAGVALLLLTLLVAGACGTRNSIHEPPPVTPTPTPTALPLPPARPDRSALYYVSSGAPQGTVVGGLGPRDGISLWRSSVPGITADVAIGGGTVYVGEGPQGRLLPAEVPMEALSEANGGALWRSQLPAAAVAPLAVRGELVFVQVAGLTPPPTPWPLPNTPTPTPAPPPAPNAIMALRAGQSAPLWRVDVLGDIFPWAVADDNALYAVIGGPDSTILSADLTAIDAHDGRVRWRVPLQSVLPAYSAPVESGGVLYFSEQYCACRTLIPSTLLAVRASDGRVLWQRTAPDGAVTTGAVVVTRGIVGYSYTRANGVGGGGIIALHIADGTPAWQVSWSSKASDGLAGGDGMLFVALATPAGDESKLTVAAYDTRTGTQLFERPLPQLPVRFESTAVAGALQEAGGTLYFVSPGMPAQTGGTAQLVSVALALRASDGSLKWAQTLDGNVQPNFVVVP